MRGYKSTDELQTAFSGGCGESGSRAYFKAYIWDSLVFNEIIYRNELEF